MKQRQHKPTSKEGETHIEPFKPSHKQKIVEALEKAKVGATHEEIAVLAGLRPDQVWKRLSEAERERTIFNTGITRKLKSGVSGIVWQLSKRPIVDHRNPKTIAQWKQIKQLQLL